ncbi:MAG: hypothetical protein GXO69_02075 [Acidobacteria bacterium]|nr:hypothetical protein [Acidobacteriota bacterium]
MKRFYFFIAIFVLTAFSFAGEGFQATYSVKVTSPGNHYGYEEKITVCGDFMRFQLSSDSFLIFNRKKGLAWKVNMKEKTAIAYSFQDNQPFYQQFLIPYGLMDDAGQLIFPQVVFKRTGNRKVVSGVPCFEAKLPGEFMNSTTTVWMPEKSVKGGGDRFSHFMSFFTKNEDFLDLIRHATGFPRRITATVRLNNSVTVNRQTLVNLKKISCKADMFVLPGGIKIQKAAPAGVPLKRF